MNNTSVIVNVNTMDDIKNINDNTKYINIGIDIFNSDVINYFLENGGNYSYTDSIEGKNGFIYATYDMFKKSETIISNIIRDMSNDLNNLEKVRYLYVRLGKLLSIDINTMDNKNEMISFSHVSIINNIWGSLSSGKTTSTCISKLFMYLCSRIGIKSELISNSISGNIGNKVYIDNYYLIIDLYNDLYNIQGKFKTKHFDKYNDNIKLDNRVLYIDKGYTDDIIDLELDGFDYTKDNMLEVILDVINRNIVIDEVGSVELSMICDSIFKNYCSNYDIRINNLFLIDNIYNKNHFIVISYNDVCYSYNYKKRCFIKVDYNIIKEYIKSNKVGLYEDECFNLGESRLVL